LYFVFDVETDVPKEKIFDEAIEENGAVWGDFVIKYAW
jgi:hypothetical protein